MIVFKVEAERQASKEEENKASEEYIQRLLAEEEEEEKRRTERRRSEMEEQLRGDEELARRLSTSIVSRTTRSHLRCLKKARTIRSFLGYLCCSKGKEFCLF